MVLWKSTNLWAGVNFFHQREFLLFNISLSKNVLSKKKYITVLSMEFSVMVKIVHICTIATSHVWLLSTWYVAHATEQLNFKFYLVLINFNSNLRLVTVVWDSHRVLTGTAQADEEGNTVLPWESLSPGGKSSTNTEWADVGNLEAFSHSIWVTVCWKAAFSM